MNVVDFFPPLNASLNALSGVLVLIAYVSIRRGRNVARHRFFMLSACATSLLFLVSYVIHHTMRGGVVTRFPDEGVWRAIYLFILTTHTILAISVLPLAIISVTLGLKNRVPQHRRIARWTFPIWLYVSTTGVLVYFFLYHWFPAR